jgi:hypothetical protein
MASCSAWTPAPRDGDDDSHRPAVEFGCARCGSRRPLPTPQPPAPCENLPLGMATTRAHAGGRARAAVDATAGGEHRGRRRTKSELWRRETPRVALIEGVGGRWVGQGPSD